MITAARAAASVARQLVVYLRRSGGRAQFSTLLAAQAAETEPIHDLLAWLPDHLDDDLTVSALARRTHLSARQFSRVFTADIGTTPADHIEAIRTEAACRLLETTRAPIEEVTRSCGFGKPETMSRTFRRRLNTTPGSHRQHFGGTS
jgi:transcriptional regulator GlxA family with amidase domain